MKIRRNPATLPKRPTSKKAKKALRLKRGLYGIRIVLQHDGRWFTVTSPDVPALITQGRSVEAARRNAESLVKLFRKHYPEELVKAFRTQATKIEDTIVVRVR